MKTIPFRKTFITNLFKPIEDFSRRHYTHAQVESILDKIQQFQIHRDNVVSELNNGNATFEDIERTLVVWLSDILILEETFPFKLSHGSIDTISVEFSWTHPFNSSIITSSHTLSYEKSAILFNIAALYSHIGFANDRTTPQGQKDSILRFQKAAGIFHILGEEINLEQQSTTSASDVIDSNIFFMNSALMFAQAQTCIYEKGVGDKLNRSLLSKLAQQISIFYTSAISYTQSIKHIPASLPIWFEVQRLAFLSAAQYQKSKHDLIEVERRSEGYGGIIARLRMSASFCRQAVTIATQTNDIQINVNDLYKTITTLLLQLEKDNKTVYLEAVPSETSLLPLETISAIQQLSDLSQICLHDQTLDSIFSNIIPNKVVIFLEEFQTRSSILLKPISSLLEDLRQQINKYFTPRHLPYIVEEISLGSPISVLITYLWKKVLQVQKQGGVKEAEQMILSVEKAGVHCQKMMESIKKKWTDEHQIDHQYSSIYKTLWERNETKQLTESLTSAIQRYTQKLQIALQANTIVRKSVSQIIPYSLYLTATKSNFEMMIPASQDIITNLEIKRKIIQASQSVIKILTNIEHVTDTLQSIKQMNTNIIPIKKKLLKLFAKGESLELFINSEIHSIQIKLTELEKECLICTEELNEFQQYWEDNKSILQTLHGKRSDYLKSLDTAATDLLRIFSDTQDGKEFFITLEQYLKILMQQVDDWIVKRKQETFDLLKTIGIYQKSQTPKPSLSNTTVSCKKTVSSTESLHHTTVVANGNQNNKSLERSKLQYTHGKQDVYHPIVSNACFEKNKTNSNLNGISSKECLQQSYEENKIKQLKNTVTQNYQGRLHETSSLHDSKKNTQFHFTSSYPSKHYF